MPNNQERFCHCQLPIPAVRLHPARTGGGLWVPPPPSLPAVENYLPRVPVSLPGVDGGGGILILLRFGKKGLISLDMGLME